MTLRDKTHTKSVKSTQTLAPLQVSTQSQTFESLQVLKVSTQSHTSESLQVLQERSAKSSELAQMGLKIRKMRTVIAMIGFAFVYRAALYVSYPARDPDFARYITFEDIVSCRIAKKWENRPKLTHLRRYFGDLHDYMIHRSIEKVRALGFDGHFSTKLQQQAH